MADGSDKGPIRNQREALEALWQSRVTEAQRRYSAAAANSLAVFREQQRFNPDGADADGSYAANRAAQLEAAALSEYKSTLKTFMELVVDGKVPPPD